MNEKTHKWWTKALGDFMSNETHGCDIDGLWIVCISIQLN